MVFIADAGMLPGMTRGAKMLLLMAFLAASALWSQAELPENPYSTILARNPFGLKDPPPPPPPAAESAPATPPAKVTVTGFVSMFGQPQVLLEIFDEPKGGGTPKKPILRQGDRMGAVEVLEIDVAKNLVKIRNGSLETNLTFEVAKTTAGPAPGAAPAPLPYPGAAPGANTIHAGGTSPTVISGGGPNGGGGGVTLVGGGSAPAPGGAAPSVTTGSVPHPNVPPALGAADPSGLRSIPTRPIRTDANGNPVSAPQFPQLPRPYAPPPAPGR